MDIVYIKNLRADVLIGIYEWERRVRQTLIIDLQLGMDNRKASSSDSIEDALDYKAITKRILQFVETSEYRLMETLAENIANILLEEFQTPWLQLSINKQGAVRHARDVGILIERGKQS
ncbi:MAG: dihydroneopterin aldolase [Candidatus Eutrophobiaceae bacterium]